VHATDFDPPAVRRENGRAFSPLGGIVTASEDEDATIYAVVVNHEEQYSIWPSHRELPRGWRAVGKEGRKAECLRYIEQVWTDMRPLSLRRKMEGNRDDDVS
jgi:MbtH protein